MWWMDVLIIVLIALGIYGFITLTRSRTRQLESHTQRTAQDMYGLYDDARSRRRLWHRGS